MTKEQEVSGKKEAVYQTVWDIYVGGTDLGLIRMGEIADKSGIPKGTIYEYFRTKDQLIAEAVSWAIDREVNKIRRTVVETSGFENKWNVILEWVCSPAARSIFVVDLIGGTKLPEGLKRELMHQKKEKCHKLDEIVDIMDDLVECGIKEGILEGRGTNLIRRTVWYSALAPVILYDKLPKESVDMTWEEIKEYSVKLLISAFGGRA